MASEKVLYWMVLGVAVLFLGNQFARQYKGSCLARRSLAVVQELSGEANHVMALAGVTLDRSTLPLVRETKVVRFQTQLASMDAAIAREQAACARMQAEQARRMALQEVQHMRLQSFCPRQALRLDVHVPRPDSTL